MRKLEWLVVKDNLVHETATFWYTAPEVKSGEVQPQDIKTEVFFFPSAQVAETEGTFTNTQRMLQWHYKAADPPGDCRTDAWFTYQLGKRLKKLYADSQAPRDQGFKNLTWDYEHDDPQRARASGEPDRAEAPEGDQRLLHRRSRQAPRRLRRAEGRRLDHLRVVDLFRRLPGARPEPRRAARQPDPPGQPGAHLNWGFAWPANRRVLYNRASADPVGQAVERAEEVGLVGRREVDRLRRAGLRRHQAADRAGRARTASASTPCRAPTRSS